MAARSIEKDLYQILSKTDSEAVYLEIGSGADSDFIKSIEDRVALLSKLYKKGIILKSSASLKPHQYSVRGCCEDFENEQGSV